MELRHVLHDLDATRLQQFERWWREQLATIQATTRAAEASAARAAEVSARLDAWRRSQAAPRLERNIQVLRLYRRGLCDLAIGKRVGLSARQVSRIIKKELGR